MKINELKPGDGNIWLCRIHCPTIEEVIKVIDYLTKEEDFKDSHNLRTTQTRHDMEDFCIVPATDKRLYTSSTSQNSVLKGLPTFTLKDLVGEDLEKILENLDARIAEMEKKF